MYIAIRISHTDSKGVLSPITQPNLKIKIYLINFGCWNLKFHKPTFSIKQLIHTLSIQFYVPVNVFEMIILQHTI